MGVRRAPGEPPGDPPEGWLRLFAGAGAEHPTFEETEFPAIDVFETPGELVVEAELPGVDPATLGVSAGDGLVVIEGVKLDQPVPGRVNYLCLERSFGAFRRVVLAGVAVDVTRASAVCRDGVLQVRVPKVDEKRGRLRAIPVTAANSGGRCEP